MQRTTLSLFACFAALLASSSAHAGWSWKKAENPATAGSSGLKILNSLSDPQSTSVACRVTHGSEMVLGVVIDGVCEYRPSLSAGSLKKNAPDYDYLASDGTPTEVKMTYTNDGFVARGSIRAKETEQGPVLCGVNGSIGWVGPGGMCVLGRGGVSSPNKFMSYVTAPNTGLTERPPLWRDLNSSGGAQGRFVGQGSSSFCRASVAASGAKIAPGVFVPAGAGKCVYVASVSNTGAPVFAETGDKSRYLVLFGPTSTTEKLDFTLLPTAGQLMLGVSGNEKVFACTTISQTPSVGVFFQGKCVVPPASGSGGGAAGVGGSLLTLFFRAY